VQHTRAYNQAPLPNFPLGIEEAGSGVNLLTASIDGPFSSAGHVPGLTVSVFDMDSWIDKRNFSSNISMPDGWSVVPNSQCIFESEYSEIHDWYDYQITVSASKTTKHHDLFWHSSHTDWFSAINKGLESGTTMFLKSQAKCISYQVHRNTLDGSAVLESEFREKVMALPTNLKDTTAYYDLVSKYGHAVIKSAVFGGKAIFLTQFNYTSFYHYKHQGGTLNDAVVNAVCGLGDKVLCNPNNPQWNSYQKFNSSALSNQITFVPFAVKNDPFIGYGGHNWSAEVQKNPGIIDWELESIANVLNPLLFPEDPKIIIKSLLLREYIEDGGFCKDSGDCGEPQPRQARWTEFPSIPYQTRWGHTAVAVDSLGIFVLGGRLDAQVSQEASPLWFDTTQQKWFYLNPPSVLGTSYALAMQGSSAVLYEDNVIVSGGDNSGLVLSFSPKSTQWKIEGSLNYPRSDHCSVNVGGMLVVLGGTYKSVVVNQTEVYNSDTQSWVEATPMPEPRFGASCSVFNDSVYIIGGVNSSNKIATSVLRYIPSVDLWVPSNVPDMSPTDMPRYYHSAAVVQNKILIIGGFNTIKTKPNEQTAISSTRILQLPFPEGTPAEWSSGCSIPTPTALAASALERTKNGTLLLHVIAGCLDNSCTSSSVGNQHSVFEIYDNTTKISCGTSLSKEPIKTETTKPPVVVDEKASTHSFSDSSEYSSSESTTEVHTGIPFIGQGIFSPTGEFTSQSLFNVACENCFTRGATVLGKAVPDAVHVNTLQECNYQASSVTLKDEFDVQVNVFDFSGADLSFGRPFVIDFGFTASAGFKMDAQATMSTEHVLMRAKAECIKFEIQFAPHGAASSPPLSSHFVTAILNLPHNVSTEQNLNSYLSVFNEFGDHFVSSVAYGGKAVQTFSMSQKNYTATLTGNFNAQDAAKESVLCFFGRSVSEEAKVGIDVNEGFTKYVSYNYTQCLPLCPPHSSDTITNSSEWNTAVSYGAGAPVSKKIVPITTLLDPSTYSGFPPNSSNHLEIVKTLLTELLTNMTFCDSVPGCHVPQHKASWGKAPGLPFNIFNAATAVDNNDTIYLVGGMKNGKPLNSVLIWEGASSKGYSAPWRWTSPLPGEPRFNLMSHVIGSKLYAIGGQNSSSTYLSAVHIFDSKTHLWTTGPSLPQPLVGSGTALVGDVLVVVGGSVAPGSNNCYAHVLDTSQSSLKWKVSTRSAQPLHGCVLDPGVAEYQGSVYMFGGTLAEGGTCSRNVLRYDLHADIWTLVAVMPQPVCAARAERIGDSIVIIGVNGTFPYLWSPSTLLFTALPQLPLPSDSRNYDTISNSKGEIFVVGAAEVIQVLKYANVQNSIEHFGKTDNVDIELKKNTPSSRGQTKKQQIRGQKFGEKNTRKKIEETRQADIPDMPFPYVNSLGFGYNTIQGDPFHPTGVDPGWASYPVFDTATITDWDGTPYFVPDDPYRWLLPKSVDGIAPTSSDDCRYFQQGLTLHGGHDVKKVLSGQHTILPSKKWGWPSFFGFEYSASETWNAVIEAYSKWNATLQLSVGWCRRYKLEVVSAPSNFTTQFVEDLSQLPEEINSTNAKHFGEFINKYGMYMPSSVSLGSLVGKFSALTEASLSAMIRAGFDISGAGKASILIFFGANAQFVAQGSGSGVFFFQENSLYNNTVCVPDCPPVGPFAPTNSEPWNEQLILPTGKVAPIGAEFVPLVDAIEQSKEQLPAELQGASLENRLGGLSAYVKGLLCSQTPSCQNLTVDRSSWEPVQNGPTTLPVPVYGSVGLTLSSALYAIGGQNLTSSSGALNAVQVYDLDVNQWVERFDLTTARAGAAGVEVQGDVWVCGGVGKDSTILSSCEVSTQKGTTPWVVQAAEMAIPRRNHVMAAIDFSTHYQIFLIGGMSTVPLDSIEVYDSNTKKWSLLAQKLPQPRYAMLSASINNTVFIFGGKSAPGKQAYSDVLAWDGKNLTALAVSLPYGLSDGFASFQTNSSVLLTANSWDPTIDAATGIVSSFLFDFQSLEFVEGPAFPWLASQFMGWHHPDVGLLIAGGQVQSVPSPNITAFTL